MITERLQLGAESLVVELASNDGYLLQHFLPLGVPVLGIEPAANVAEVATEQGRPDASSSSSASRLRRSWWPKASSADLIVGNNVLAQVPDLNDFVAGMKHPAEAARASSRWSSRISSG